MSATTYTLTGNVRDLVGADASSFKSPPKGYIVPSQPAIVDPADNTLRLGNKELTIDPVTGAFVVTLVGTGALVAGYSVVLLWRDDSVGAAVRTYQSGYFTLTANKTLAAAIAEAGSGAVIPIGATLDTAAAALVLSPTSATTAALATTYAPITEPLATPRAVAMSIVLGG